MEDLDINQLLLDQELDWLMLLRLQVEMLEYKEAQVITFILMLILLIRAVTVNQHRIVDGSHLMDAPTKLLKAKIMKEMSIKFTDGLMKNRSPMRQITGLTPTTTSINAIVGLMKSKLFMKQSK
jgi:hypothetical protein